LDPVDQVFGSLGQGRRTENIMHEIRGGT